jgi:hypothetical protein
MLGIEVVGVILAGWASNNKWSVYGAMREACQMVSYEIPMGMSLLIPVMTAGTLQLTAIANQQGDGFASWFVFKNPWCFLAFFSYYTASLASCKRAPFDLPESESEFRRLPHRIQRIPLVTLFFGSGGDVRCPGPRSSCSSAAEVTVPGANPLWRRSFRG